MKFSIKDFLSKCDQIRSFLRIWSHLLKKSLMENFIFCAVVVALCEHTFLHDTTWNLSVFFRLINIFYKVYWIVALRSPAFLHLKARTNLKWNLKSVLKILKIHRKTPVPEPSFSWSYRLKTWHFIYKDSSTDLSLRILQNF